MADTGNVAVEKKKRKRTKKNKKNAVQQPVISVAVDDNTDSDEDEDEIFNYLNMSPSSAQAQNQKSSAHQLAVQELNAYEGNHMGKLRCTCQQPLNLIWITYLLNFPSAIMDVI